MRRWTESEVAYLIRVGAHDPDSAIGKKLGRTTDAVKCKKSELGILKVDPPEYDRIPFEPEVPRPTIVDLATAPRFEDIVAYEGDVTDEQVQSYVIMMFLSRLDEFDMTTLNRLEIAIGQAKRGLELLHGRR